MFRLRLPDGQSLPRASRAGRVGASLRNPSAMTKHQICRNCGSEVTGNYCSACGQRTTTHRLDWASLAENVTSTFIGDEAYGLRGMNMRKGTVTTWLSILFQPHITIPEYIAGHRRKYFNPVAILLLLSTFYAIVYALVGKTYTPMANQDQHLFVWLFCTYIDYASLHPAANMLLTLPFFALALKTVFGKRAGLKYVEYLYIGIFLSIFEMTLMIFVLPIELLVPKYSSFYALTLPTFLYTAFVLWKMFGLKKRSALWRTLLTKGLQYAYATVAVVLLLGGILGGYYLTVPKEARQQIGQAAERADNNTEWEYAFGEFVEVMVGYIFKDQEPSSAQSETSDEAQEEQSAEVGTRPDGPHAEKTEAQRTGKTGQS